VSIPQPLESERTGDDLDVATHLNAHPYAAVAASDPVHSPGGILRGRSFRLRLPGRTHQAR